MEVGLCEEQLNQVDILLQLDVWLLVVGKVLQWVGEVEWDLDKVDSMIWLLFNDVQIFKDGWYLQGEQMYCRVYCLYECLVVICIEYNFWLKVGVVVFVIQVIQVILQRCFELEDFILCYLQDLLVWVEENQYCVDGVEWGVDLFSVEVQLGSY